MVLFGCVFGRNLNHAPQGGRTTMYVVYEWTPSFIGLRVFRVYLWVALFLGPSVFAGVSLARDFLLLPLEVFVGCWQDLSVGPGLLTGP